MRKKKEEKKPEFEELGSISVYDYEYSRYGMSKNCGKTLIPKGATHLALEIDTSGCYYEGDMPSYRMHFFKEKK